MSSVKSFLDSTEEKKLEETPDYFVASTANFISLTENFLKENYREPEKLVQQMKDNQKINDMMAAENQKLASEKISPKDVEEETKKYEEKGFYSAKKDQNEAEKLTHGTFYYEKGKIYYGKAETREPVSYSNWYAGNVDPEELERHKQLLDRQHFGGPMWENRKMPKSVMDETFEEYLTGIIDDPAEKHPKELGITKEAVYEKVKR